MNIQTDVLVIGSGAAGLTLALNLQDYGKICVISKNKLDSGSSNYAQGGIAAVLDSDDSITMHTQDTLIAGAGLCDEKAVKFTTSNGKKTIDWLIQQGVEFSTEDDDNNDDLHLTKEGGHSKRRVAHVADNTGRAIQTELIANAKKSKNIQLLTNHTAIDLVTKAKTNTPQKTQCIGAYVLDNNKGKVITISAKYVVLATGGACRVYLYSSNPDGSTGDGIAMAWRAGCRVANMEFMQFHPTCLYHPQAKNFLISEAVRGEGGILRLKNGDAFMKRFDKRLDLAPRDIVARAIDSEMKRTGDDCVFLDITHQSPEFIKKHFPTIYKRCLSFGFDMTKEAIPVVPATHYTCGGVVADLDGKTDIENLFAIGETTFTGLHGANRLASNSLLECIVFASSAAKTLTQALLDDNESNNSIPDWDESRVSDSDEEVIISHNWQELRRSMWNYVGIVRTDKRLQRAKNRIDLLTKETQEYYSNFKVTADLLELRNLTLVSDLIVQSSMTRKESVGLNYNTDYPENPDKTDYKTTILVPNNFK